MTDIVYTFKRGDDFSIPMNLTDPGNADAPVDITGWTITSQVRYAKELIDNLNVTVTDAANGLFTISLGYTDTASWPIRRLKCDIQFDRPVLGRVSSQTFYIDVEEDQTQ